MEETGLVFRPFINPWVVGGLAALLVTLSVAGYARTTRPITRQFKTLLLGLRFGAIAVIVICLLRPSLQVTHYEMSKRPLVLLIDQSRSMKEIDDTADGATRLTAVNRLLAIHEEDLERLRGKYELMVLGFARGLLGRSGETAAATNYSAYGLAMQQAFIEMADSRSDALVIIGDGSHNFGPPDPLDVAAALNDQGVPVYTLGVGRDQATSELRDVKVVDITAPKSAFLFTSFPVRVNVLFRGCQGRPVTVRLGANGLVSQQKVVTVVHSEETVPLQFDVVAEDIGEYEITVRADEVPNEILAENNSTSAFVKVISGGVRAGFFDAVRPESKFIAHALTGAEHLRLRRVLVLAGQQLPDAQTQIDRYDVAMIGDILSSAIRPSHLLALRRAVQEEGKGLIVLMTQQNATREGWRDTVIEDLLPVKLVGGARIIEGGREFRIDPAQVRHPVLALAETARETREAWASLPPLAGAVGGLEVKRGATVLAKDQDGNPLLVVHRSGRGRVACLMADTTSRWFFTEQNTQDYHRRFWRQLVLWAAGREDRPQGHLWVELNKQQLLMDEKLKIAVHLVGQEDEPIRDAQLALRITDPADKTQDVSYTFSRQEGAYVAEFSPPFSGEYTVIAEAERDGRFLGQDKSHFQAHSVDVELEDPVADLKLLRRISAVTEESGGKYYGYLQAGELFEELERRGAPLKLTTRRRRDIWDSWPLFALFAACLVTEWALRKRKGLV